MSAPEKITLETPIQELHRYGVAKLSAFAGKKLAGAVANFADKNDSAKANVEDLLMYLPMRYEDRSNLTTIDSLYDGFEGSVELYVRVSGGFQVGKNRSARQPSLYIFEITASDAERKHKPVVIWWFLSGKAAMPIINSYKERFDRGIRFVAYGRWEWDARRNTFSLKLNKPDELEILPGEAKVVEGGLLESLFAPDEPPEKPQEKPVKVSKDASDASDESLDEDIATPELAAIHVARRVPVYRKLGQFQTKRMREIMHDVTAKLDEKSIPEKLPAGLPERQNLIPRYQALKEIHFPPENVSLIEYAKARSAAHLRLIFDELFWVSLVLQYRRGERAKQPKGTKIKIPKKVQENIAAVLPFTLTGAQKKVIRTIFEDLESDAPMNRLVQGDVGSGKTIVAVMAMMAAMENGYQAALMAPTEILAEQHSRNIKRLLANTPYRVEMLIGSLKVGEKRKLTEALAAGEIHAMVGTHALIQETVQFQNLGLAVVDEQHRFGVLQRAELQRRGYNLDVLVMTATPIPRSLAMTIYGDLDASVIDELPPGRTPIKTVVVGEDQRRGVYKGVEREIDAGKQVYVVYPLVEESEKLDLKAATKMFEELRDKVFPKYKVGLVHGRMKAAEKEEVMHGFVSGEVNILVSTTVIEVGVDVPNASLMIVEHAERFGLSQLHQLRGRVGRGADQSFCVLMTGDKQTAVAKERLGIMEETNDGFKIAEKDLEIRGQGDILGTRQSGLEMFKVANIVRDLEILEAARKEAEYYLSKDAPTAEKTRLIKLIQKQQKFHLAGIG
ncbi:MAG TPA: ATP-dependent DNA helicase RecG [Pyrinomonadaceae bacterium]|jgi:ATP-dependent DNA helicase RecG|nr:ATP-dependent DNA helicase RecG [Pyrinomonadaceae bacterium]